MTTENPQTLPLDAALQQAIAHHQAGQLPDAERLYRAILQSRPDHPDANHNLGVLAVQVKQPAAGLPHFKAALEARPNQGQYWLSYIDALLQAGQQDAARRALDEGRQRGLPGEASAALAARLADDSRLAGRSSAVEQARQGSEGNIPDPQEIETLVALFAAGKYAEAASFAEALTVHFPLHGFGWKALGAVLRQLGRSADALAPMQKAAALWPDDAEAHSNLGNALADLDRLVEAEASYRRALQIKPDFAEAHNSLGVTLKDLGRLDEAVTSYRRALQIKPDYAEAHSNLGNTLRQAGRLDEAEASYRRALQLNPQLAVAHFNLGNALHDLGRLDEAEVNYRAALRINPDYAEACYNLGNTLHDLGRLDEAQMNYRHSLAIKPDQAEAHNNLGATLKDMGRLDEAEVFLRKALAIEPDYAEAHSNLAFTLKDMGRLDEAEASYRQALQIKPDSVDALNNLALLLNAQGKMAMALEAIRQSLRIRETDVAKRIFVACLKSLRWRHDDSEVRTLMVRALTEPWGRPNDLARICSELVKLNPDVAACLTRAAGAWPRRLSAQKLFGANGVAPVAANALLCALLESASVCDMAMERFLTMARRVMLEAAARTTDAAAAPDAALGFYSALAGQCFINEYVFSHTDYEIRKAGDLRDSLVAALEADRPLPVLWVVAVAAYFPLASIAQAARLLDRQWPEAVATLLTQQVREPLEELQERTRIPRLTGIEDEVSLLVQDQYEANPYPRWVKIAPAGKPLEVNVALRRIFPLTPFLPLEEGDRFDILIAGCGTGQHSIDTAQRFLGARVLAVDLSLASLAYARRKTREQGLSAIEYAHADLLKLGALGRSFDVIESVGVLHHLADPWAGWQALLSLLRPGGVMKLGFYSEAARRNIVKARTFIAERAYGATADEIRRCRQDMVNFDKGAEFASTLESSDFFSISGCRDLLFHVQEHRMTLTGIEAFLRENKLAFLGFDMDVDVLYVYKQRFPEDCAATNLAQWQIFENENPDTFAGMYQFWIQKAA